MLTAAGVVLLVMQLGQGAPLFLAMLGGAAVWLLLAPFAIAMPAGAFAVSCSRGPSRRWSPMKTRPAKHYVSPVLALMLSTLTVGWLVPRAYQETGRAVSRLVPDGVRRTDGGHTRETTLDQLVDGARSIPGAGKELLRRAAWVLPSFLAPLFAAILVRVRARWKLREAVAATLVIFGISVRLAMGSVM